MRSKSRLRQKETGRLRYINSERTARSLNRGFLAESPATLFGLRSGAIIVTNGFFKTSLPGSFFSSRRPSAAVAAAGHDADVALFESPSGSCRLGIAEKRTGDFQSVTLMHDRTGMRSDSVNRQAGSLPENNPRAKQCLGCRAPFGNLHRPALRTGRTDPNNFHFHDANTSKEKGLQ